MASDTPRHGNSQTGSTYDLVIIGGGINGTGIARDAVGRGLKVLLCEQGDLACATSSASSKLVHGGLRYLEHGQFRLVQEALKEREILLANGRHLVRPMRFRLPHAPHLRPAWVIRAGLFLYDTLARRRKLAGSCAIHLDSQSPLKPAFTRAFAYSDCWADDARLVITNAISARDLGADIAPRTRCQSARRLERHWHIELVEQGSSQLGTVQAKALVNATGPWVAQFIEQGLQAQPEYGIRMVKGSHIVVPALYKTDEAYILQHRDKRIVFVIPWQQRWSMIGTTDVEYQGDPAGVEPSDDEERYLLDIANHYFNKQCGQRDIVWRFAGVRPLCSDQSSDPSTVTRDYTLTVSDQREPLPLLNVFGGKLTTFRRLAESALEKLKPWFPELTPPWTEHGVLPGGHISSQGAYAQQLLAHYPWLTTDMARRYAGSYGTLCQRFLSPCHALGDMGHHFGNGLYQREVDYLCEHEWAMTAEDILWRRSKLGLGLSRAAVEQLGCYLKSSDC